MLEGFRKADALLPSVARAAAGRKVATARALIRRGRATVEGANRGAIAVGLADCRRA